MIAVMKNTLPSQNLELLKSFLGKKIATVKRQLFKGDMDFDEYEQSADGPVEFRFHDNTLVHFIAETELFSIGVIAGNMPRYGDSYVLHDVSDNPFWQDRVNQEICQVVVMKASGWSDDYPSEFGVEFLFKNGKQVQIEYLDEENYPDMIKVSGRYTNSHSNVIRFTTR